MSQLRYELNKVEAYAGLRGDLHDGVYSISRAAESDLAFGIFAQFGTDPAKQALPFTGGTLAGVVEHEHRMPASANDAKVDQYDAAALMRQGSIWVEVEDGQTPAVGGAVFADNTSSRARTDATGGTAVAGTFLSAAVDTGTYSEASASTIKVALISINLD